MLTEATTKTGNLIEAITPEVSQMNRIHTRKTSQTTDIIKDQLMTNLEILTLTTI